MKLYMLIKDIIQVTNDGTVINRQAYFYGKTKEEAKFHYLESKKNACEFDYTFIDTPQGEEVYKCFEL